MTDKINNSIDKGRALVLQPENQETEINSISVISGCKYLTSSLIN